MKNKHLNILMGTVAGALAGGLVAWYLTSKNDEELEEEFRNITSKVKQNIDEQISKLRNKKTEG